MDAEEECQRQRGCKSLRQLSVCEVATNESVAEDEVSNEWRASVCMSPRGYSKTFRKGKYLNVWIETSWNRMDDLCRLRPATAVGAKCRKNDVVEASVFTGKLSVEGGGEVNITYLVHDSGGLLRWQKSTPRHTNIRWSSQSNGSTTKRPRPRTTLPYIGCVVPVYWPVEGVSVVCDFIIGERWSGVFHGSTAIERIADRERKEASVAGKGGSGKRGDNAHHAALHYRRHRLFTTSIKATLSAIVISVLSVDEQCWCATDTHPGGLLAFKSEQDQYIHWHSNELQHSSLGLGVKDTGEETPPLVMNRKRPLAGCGNDDEERQQMESEGSTPKKKAVHDKVSIPGRVTPEFSHVGIVPHDATGRRVFLKDLPFPPILSFQRCSVLTSIAFIGSQDLDVKIHPNLFTSRLHDNEGKKDTEVIAMEYNDGGNGLTHRQKSTSATFGTRNKRPSPHRERSQLGSANLIIRGSGIRVGARGAAILLRHPPTILDVIDLSHLTSVCLAWRGLGEGMGEDGGLTNEWGSEMVGSWKGESCCGNVWRGKCGITTSKFGDWKPTRTCVCVCGEVGVTVNELKNSYNDDARQAEGR
ncbi:hypothetical protein PR048_008689 [Dryococelus australis]|uniref:Uncharacterized protein n=1 Tax=Dryococelus australis TaxID=614101 RepID=A0ABQ9HY70_9NEOP|nr:hypothetical protein PR048_008689 [Dryococelus australis]